MRHVRWLRRRYAIVLLPIVLVGCGGSSAKYPETAEGAGVALQSAGIYQPQPLHVSSADVLAAEGSLDSTYKGVATNVYSAIGDEPTIWQFTTVKAAKGAFAGLHPALAAGSGDYYFICGSLLIVGDSQPKATAAQAALAKHFKDCVAVSKVPATTS